MSCKNSTNHSNNQISANGGTPVQNTHLAWKPLTIASGFVNPMWLNSIRGREVEGNVIEQGVIECNGEKLQYSCNKELPVGTNVIVRCLRVIQNL